MPAIEQKTTFKASDGCEFKSREEAESYEAMRAAGEEFETAVRKYNIALAKTLKTADGYPFALGERYFIVCERFNDDFIDHEYFYQRQTRVWLDEHGRGRISFVGSGANRDKVVEFFLENIYAKERNAKLQLLELRKRRLGWLEEDIAKLERNLGIEPKEGGNVSG